MGSFRVLVYATDLHVLGKNINSTDDRSFGNLTKFKYLILK
jgi:hypothetical protein